jgi:glycerol kinase
MTGFLLTLDQSTSGTKALLIDVKGTIIAKRSLEHQQYYPQAGWVEHDPMEIYENVKILMKAVIQDAAITPDQIVSISITNQRETALIWDADTGEPVHRAIVWQCRRTTSICDELKAAGLEPIITSKTGLLLDPYFSATKWRWLTNFIKNSETSGRWLAGTMDSWLIWKLTGGAVHATDYTNASRTLLFNIHSLDWDSELIRIFGLEGIALPEVKVSDDVFGYLENSTIFGGGFAIPICGVMGDSQAALFAQRCTDPGMAKATYGTGSSVLLNVGSIPVEGRNGLVSTLAWKLKGQTRYALEGIIHSAGDCLKWARDNMNLFDTYEELEKLTVSVHDTDGVYVVPAFVGLGAPYWDPMAKAAFVGMSRSTTRAHVLRACVESIGFQVRDVVELITRESGIDLIELRADGGASKNKFLMQFQSDILGRPVAVSRNAELSAFGAAYASGLGIGFWTENDLNYIYQTENNYIPTWNPSEKEKHYSGWQTAISSVMGYKANQQL